METVLPSGAVFLGSDGAPTSWNRSPTAALEFDFLRQSWDRVSGQVLFSDLSVFCLLQDLSRSPHFKLDLAPAGPLGHLQARLQQRAKDRHAEA